MITDNTRPRRLQRRPRDQRGIAMVWMISALVVIMLSGSFAVDMSYLYDRREKVQAAADAAALAGDWAEAMGETDANSEAQAAQVLTYNGYTTAGGSTITYNPHANSTQNNFSVTVSNPEPMFFGGVVGNHSQTLTASATATFTGNETIWFQNSTYGEADGAPFVLCSYGPDQGATRGDDVDARWNDVTGVYVKAPNPLDYNGTSFTDKGQTYVIQPAVNWSSVDPYYSTNPNLMIQIYDPQTSVQGTTPLDQYVSTTGTGLSTSSSPNEKWIYTVYAQNNTTGVDTQIATATYGETQTADANLWVTPPGFSFPISSYDLTNTTFLLNVRTGNPYQAGQNNALDKNGYLIRAGGDYTNVSTLKNIGNTSDAYGDYVVTSPSATGASTGTNTKTGLATSSSSMYDATWNSTNGSLAPAGAQSNLCVTAIGSTNGADINFGYLSANPNVTLPSIITFNGFDEDSGATSINYTVTAPGQSYNGIQFTGILGYQATDRSGNGVWSAAGPQNRGVSNPTTPSNTVYFPAGTYSGGSWNAVYATGAEDVTTWNWTVNWASHASNGDPYLIYTTHSDY